MRLFIFSVALLLSGVACFGQSVAKKFTAPLCGKVVLRDADDKYNANVYNLEMPEPDGDADQKMLRAIKAQIAVQYPHKVSRAASKTSATLEQPAIGVNFVADSNSGIPPDNYSAVDVHGRTVSVMNQTIAVHNAATGAYLVRKGLKAFSLAVGLNNITYDDRYDPKITYDPVADRYICVMLNGTNAHNWIVLGFSQTDDPTGAWNFYKFYGDYLSNTTWFDYPAIAITRDEYFLTGNKIIYDSSWQAGFTRTLIYQVRKQDGYNGNATLTYQIWDSVTYNGGFLRCLYPLNPGDSVKGPAQYFLSNRNFAINNDSVFLVKVPDTIGSTDTVLTVTPIVSSSGSYGAPPDGRQPDTSVTLATNDGRVLGGFIEGNQIQFVSASLNPASGAAAVFHGVIDNFATSPVMHGQLIGVDTLDFGYPNISYAGIPGHSIISFDYSGPGTFPGFAAVLSDGNNYSNMLVIRKGDTTVNLLAQKEQRWGDYSGSQPDWTSPGAVWVEGIYGKKRTNTYGTYGNYMAQLISPYHVNVPVQQKATASSTLYPNPVYADVSFEFTVGKEQNFSFYVYDMQGRMVDKITDNHCREGRNVIRFDMAPLKPGNYLLKAVGSEGESIAVHSFVRE